MGTANCVFKLQNRNALAARVNKRDQQRLWKKPYKQQKPQLPLENAGYHDADHVKQPNSVNVQLYKPTLERMPDEDIGKLHYSNYNMNTIQHHIMNDAVDQDMNTNNSNTTKSARHLYNPNASYQCRGKDFQQLLKAHNKHEAEQDRAVDTADQGVITDHIFSAVNATRQHRGKDMQRLLDAYRKPQVDDTTLLEDGRESCNESVGREKTDTDASFTDGRSRDIPVLSEALINAASSLQELSHIRHRLKMLSKPMCIQIGYLNQANDANAHEEYTEDVDLSESGIKSANLSQLLAARDKMNMLLEYVEHKIDSENFKKALEEHGNIENYTIYEACVDHSPPKKRWIAASQAHFGSKKRKDTDELTMDIRKKQKTNHSSQTSQQIINDTQANAIGHHLEADEVATGATKKRITPRCALEQITENTQENSIEHRMLSPIISNDSSNIEEHTTGPHPKSNTTMPKTDMEGKGSPKDISKENEQVNVTQNTSGKTNHSHGLTQSRCASIHHTETQNDVVVLNDGTKADEPLTDTAEEPKVPKAHKQVYKIGTKVSRQFVVGEKLDKTTQKAVSYAGKVEAFDAKLKMYKILYDDGDSEWLEEKIISAIVLKPKKHTRAKKTKLSKKPASPKSVIPEPNKGATPHVQQMSGAKKSPPPDHAYLKNLDVKPNKLLPPGWKWHSSEGHKRWYCFEAGSRKRVWYPEEIPNWSESMDDDLSLEDLF